MKVLYCMKVGLRVLYYIVRAILWVPSLLASGCAAFFLCLTPFGAGAYACAYVAGVVGEYLSECGWNIVLVRVAVFVCGVNAAIVGAALDLVVIIIPFFIFGAIFEWLWKPIDRLG